MGHSGARSGSRQNDAQRPLPRVSRPVPSPAAVPPGTMRPYALPGAAALHERRWRRRLAKAPVMTSAEHAAAVGVRDIEEPAGCVLCGEQRMQPLLRPRDYHVVRCVGCGLLFRHPGIQARTARRALLRALRPVPDRRLLARPEAALRAGARRVRAAVRRRRRAPAYRLRLRCRAVPRARGATRLPRHRHRPVGERGRACPRGRPRRVRPERRVPCRRSRPEGSTSSRCGRSSRISPPRSRTWRRCGSCSRPVASPWS